MKKLTRENTKAFLKKHASDEKVLDIGSGNMDQDVNFPNRTTFDIDPARKPQIVGDAHELPFENASFSCILCSEVLEHLYDPRKAIAEMYRVLKPGGIVVLTTRFIFPVHDAPHDYFRFTPYGLRMLFEDWEIVEEASETGTFGTIAVLLQRIIFQTDLQGGKFTKGILYVLMNIFQRLDFLVKAQYGDIQRSRREADLLTSGVYIVARKPG